MDRSSPDRATQQAELRSELARIVSLCRNGEFPAAAERAAPLLDRFPSSLQLWNLYGTASYALGRMDDAERAFRQALALKPGEPAICNNLGGLLLGRGRLDEAIACFRQAVESRPDYARAHFNLGKALKDRGGLDEAVGSYREAVRLHPGFTDAWVNLGVALKEQGAFAEAEKSYRRALETDPDAVDALYNLAALSVERDRIGDAISSFEALLRIKPDHWPALAQKLFQQARICDWSCLEEFAAVAGRLGIEGEAVAPFATLVFEDDPERQMLRSQLYAHQTFRQEMPPPLAARPKSGKIRLGYFSADFHDHATLYLMSGLLREHDRDRFEIHAYSYGTGRSGAMREAAIADVDRFTDVHGMADHAIADLARGHELDIAIDLKGYTRQSRPGLFALRLAPVQIAYLGYPGTMGADFIDYLIADPVVIPDGEKRFYTEKLLFLPNSYQPNDNRREIAQAGSSRADFGLPGDGFVFCCFNQNYKITPREFDIWMRLLGRVDGSVLWLLRSNEWAEANLRREARARGIDPDRLVFAGKLPHGEHLARHAHADLFLDTFNVNAHTTASDALWAGLPIVTRAGRQFAARVAASLLAAVGLPELIAGTDEAYEALALDLATDPDRLAAIRAKLAANRLSQPLFDTVGYTRDFEAALETVLEGQDG
ncbi:MAG: tetratricopeptide repeat protein [Novosphingobium sp.]|nr:tetratricopeptide repeat protein [Novosphingobium sp.]MCP5401406.1 tetratricopeptide repeat protein [Novosphingobium sp.]